jgi:ribosomal protein L40E
MVYHSIIMGVLVWGLLVLVVFPLLQMPLIIYIARHVESDDEELPYPARKYSINSERIDSEYNRSIRSFDTESSEETDSSTVTCPRCGTENDPDFTYCRNCITKLPPTDSIDLSR